MHRFLENAAATLNAEPIMQLAQRIDWQPVENILQAERWLDLFRNGGRVPYDYRAMVRALLLAEWHELSYPKLERALHLRLDFVVFCGFVPNGKLPDASTFSRFKARLSASGLFEAVCEEIETQLRSHGLALRRSSGALGDMKLMKLKSPGM